MAGVEFSEWDKKILRMGLKAISKRLKKGEPQRDEDLKFNPNPIVNVLGKLIELTAGNLKAKWQAATIRTYGKFTLWLVIKDTAYRDAFFWMLYKLLKSADKLLPLIEPYVKPPELWFPNVWVDTKEATHKKREKGEIPDNALSLQETVFLPRHTKKR